MLPVVDTSCFQVTSLNLLYNVCRRYKILLKFGDLFAIRCRIVVAKFGQNPMLFARVMKIYTLYSGSLFSGHTLVSLVLEMIACDT